MVDFWIGKCDNDAVHQAWQIAAERNHSCHFLNKSPMDDFNKPFQLHLLTQIYSVWVVTDQSYALGMDMISRFQMRNKYLSYDSVHWRKEE